MTRSHSVVGYDQQRHELFYLYELDYSGGTLRLTNANMDVSWNGQTWVALGGNLIHDAANENPDPSGHQLTLRLFGVDQTIISGILTNNFKGRNCRIWLVHWDPDAGGIAGTPYLIWKGRQLGDYEISEDRESSDDSGGTVEVTTTILSSLSAIRIVRSVRTNPISHKEMLRRAGLSTVDDFFARVITLAGKEIIWGAEAPTRISGGVDTDGESWHKGKGRYGGIDN